MSRRILVALDNSPQSWDAFRYALAEHPDAEIITLHVINPLTAVLRGEVHGGATKRSEEEANNIQEEAEDIAQSFGVGISTVIEEGRPARVIVEYAQEHDIDHIVMGSHGRDGLSRILVGSVAERVMRRAATPVTIYR